MRHLDYLITRLGEDKVRERYGNLFDIYHEITAENAYQTPMRIFPAVHYTMGGLWVDYETNADGTWNVDSHRNQMTNVPGLYAAGECEFQYHGANRLGANALLACLVGLLG